VPEDHFQRLLRLMDVESRAEAQQTRERLARLSPQQAEQAGTSLVDMAIADEYAGLGGRLILTLVKRNRTLGLPWTRLGTGSPVLLSAEGVKDVGVRGVVSDRNERLIRVAVNEFPEEFEEYATWRIDLSSDEVARGRQRTALNAVRTAERGRLAEFKAVTLKQRPARSHREIPFEPYDTSLNPPQLEAVAFALKAADLAIIHGPPGTGKTTTVIELIRQAIARGEKVLACAPSNLAVDNLLERLIRAGERAVRLGHPARVVAELRQHTLDLMVEEHEDVRLAHKLVKDALALRRKAARYTRAKPAPGERNELRQEARELFADARRLENQAVKHILDTASVLCVTTTGISNEILGDREFDLCVIDEAGQTTEPPCWIPLLRSKRVVLAGDHFQLPPTVVSPEAAGQGFSVSLLERVALEQPELSRRLTIQYRMHDAIMGFSSLKFYDGQLAADGSVCGHRLCDLPGVQTVPMTETPLELIDTAGAGYDEETEPDGESRLNPQEADLIVRKVQELIALGLGPRDIAVIAPYAAQVRLIRSLLEVPGVEVDSVDGFQGREKEAVIVSLVRSNATGEIGFLADTRRMNVAITRARRKLLMVGDSATLSAHPFYRDLFEYIEGFGAYRTVWDEA